ncbi:MAG: hypothetical protein ACK5YO_32540, partial [Planctomyces sp.]
HHNRAGVCGGECGKSGYVERADDRAAQQQPAVLGMIQRQLFCGVQVSAGDFRGAVGCVSVQQLQDLCELRGGAGHTDLRAPVCCRRQRAECGVDVGCSEFRLAAH